MLTVPGLLRNSSNGELYHHRGNEVLFSVKPLLSLGTLDGKTSRLVNSS